MTLPERECTICRKRLAATPENFGLHRDSKSGTQRLRAQCRKCRAQVERERHYRKTGNKPPEKRPGMHYCTACLTWKPANREHFITDRGKVRAPCIECSRKRNRRSYARHATARMASVSAWRKRNPHKALAYGATVRARRFGAQGTHTSDEISRLHEAQCGKCHWCGKTMRGKFERDHRIPLVAGGANDISNIVLAHPECNRAKNRKMPWEFIPGRLL